MGLFNKQSKTPPKTPGEAAYETAVALGDANNAEKFRLMLQSAEAGYPLAATAVGDMYYHGIGVERDPVIAKSWYFTRFDRYVDSHDAQMIRKINNAPDIRPLWVRHTSLNLNALRNSWQEWRDRQSGMHFLEADEAKIKEYFKEQNSIYRYKREKIMYSDIEYARKRACVMWFEGASEAEKATWSAVQERHKCYYYEEGVRIAQEAKETGLPHRYARAYCLLLDAITVGGNFNAAYQLSLLELNKETGYISQRHFNAIKSWLAVAVIAKDAQALENQSRILAECKAKQAAQERARRTADDGGSDHAAKDEGSGFAKQFLTDYLTIYSALDEAGFKESDTPWR